MTQLPGRLPRVAVIGSGVSGLTAAHLLRATHDVTLFEVDDRLGGHAHTHDGLLATADDGRPTGVDTGFIVHNDRTYPLLRRLFGELGVAVRPTEMSMSIHCDGCGLEYAGGRGPGGLLAQPRRLADPAFVRLLLAVRRFQRLATAHLDRVDDADPQTYGDWLREHDFDRHFVAHYAVPVVSCVWSSGHDTALEYPAAYLFRFLSHHGFLTPRGAPQWYTVVGGSRRYVDAIAEGLHDVRVGVGAAGVRRGDDGVVVRDTRGTEHAVDRVVVATHADDALGLLEDASPAEKRVLGAFDYSRNDTVLHTDASLLPTAPRARASWNYSMASCDERSDHTVVSYWMNRLQGLDGERAWVVSLNSAERVADSDVLARMTYTHPIYTPAAVAAQRELASLADDRTVFAGAYHGWGFHEDGCRSGVAAAEHFGGGFADGVVRDPQVLT